MTVQPIVAVAGAGGDLGLPITSALVGRGAIVRALIRPELPAAERNRIEAAGATLAAANPMDVRALADACVGAACAVLALNGLRPVMIARQSVLLDAAVAAGVPRFIPSDFSADFTRTTPGDNRSNTAQVGCRTLKCIRYSNDTVIDFETRPLPQK